MHVDRRQQQSSQVMLHSWALWSGDLHTNAGQTHTLRAVAPGAGAVIAPPGILTNLVVSALVCAVSTLINVCEQHGTSELGNALKIKINS